MQPTSSVTPARCAFPICPNQPDCDPQPQPCNPASQSGYSRTRTGETISYNAFRKLAANVSTIYDSKVKRFETTLARTNDLVQAKRESGISGRQLTAYRRQFEEERRGSASPLKGRPSLAISRFARLYPCLYKCAGPDYPRDFQCFYIDGPGPE